MEERKVSENAQKEEEILRKWEERDIFRKTLEKDAPQGEFVFYEGPPTANGRPGIHHLESRSFKDAIPRYKTMRGYRVPRKAGWDTHGLPVEIEVEKELGFSGKPDIEEYGIEKFNEKCKESVWKYVEEWERFTKRIGYWVDLDNPYITYHPSYMESLWSVFKHISDQGLLYRDYKVLPWCPRCGTALSSHELAQGYADVKDLSVTAEFEVMESSHPELSKEVRTVMLAWTTTPWTLPGNVGLAVGKDIEYVILEKEDEGGEGRVRFVLANDLVEKIFEGSEYTIVATVSGSDLLGTQYRPLYPYLKDLADVEGMENAYKVYAADFVTTEDGTGIVHTAVMYGQDDFVLGTEVGLPKFHLVDEDGHFIQGTDFLEGRFVKSEETDIEIIKDLAHRGLLFNKKKYEHSYPHCWRCKTPLIYYARDSWYVNMQNMKETLISENKEINWEPEHIKNGRFGEWLEGLRDWAISRERYWGTPLPVWENEDKSRRIVIGSVAELHEKVKTGTTFVCMRHAEAEHNVKSVLNSTNNNPMHLTDAGRSALEDVNIEGVDYIFHSPLVRTAETAEIMREKLGLSPEVVFEDERLREFDFGDLDGKDFGEYVEFRKNHTSYFRDTVPGGESFADVRKRVGELMYELDEKYRGKKILLIGHGATLEVFVPLCEGMDTHQSEAFMRSLHEKGGFSTAHVEERAFARLPHNKEYEIDLHRPYVDDVEWEEDGEVFKRTPEVMDVWFDSGAMPFAQHHYPFENKEYVDTTGFPADYISEAIDQTRGWFYTLHAIGSLMGKGLAYKNVICLGHLLDKEGAKMSKSKGNTVNPWEMADKYGVDALRFWMYSVNQPGESKNFDESTVDEIVKKVFNIVRNVLNFWEMYESGEDVNPYESPHVLDKWILVRLDALVKNATKSLDSYNLIDPTREIRDFIGDDLSRWYIRRSRDRFKGEDEKDKEHALSTTKHVLLTLSKLMAPFTPFIAEEMYGALKGEKESVHLEEWPVVSGDVDYNLLDMMKRARIVVSLVLDKRVAEGVKVRQPLQSLTINDAKYGFPSNAIGDGLLKEIKEEVNVKEIHADEEIEDIELNMEISIELRDEGRFRELLRGVQSLRKDKGLDPEDRIILHVTPNAVVKELVEAFEDQLRITAGVQEVNFVDGVEGVEVVLDDDVNTTIAIEE